MSPTPQNDVTTRRSGRKSVIALLIALALSLAVNLLGVGYLLGRDPHAGRDPRSHHRLHGGPAQLREFMHSRSDARRAELAVALDRYRDALRNGARSMIAARRTLGEELRREPLDLKAVRAAMAQVDQAMLEGSRRHHEALLPLLQQLTAEERAQFARQRRLGSGREHRRERRDDILGR
ncbi:MAG: periplasmic heavy metal sensor [Pseudomonadota bacterium]